MSGWFYIGEEAELDRRVEAFRNVFAVTGVPELELRQVSHAPDPLVFCWMWKESADWPDFDIATAASARKTLILDGYITGTGRFDSESDSADSSAKSILQLWLQHGEALVPELNGSFSLTVIDHASGAATVITDRLGSRPVWLGYDSECALIGNLTAAVAALFLRPLHLDPAGLWSLLAGQRPVGQKSLYSEIGRIGAGRLAQITGATTTSSSHRWYELRYRPDTGRSLDAWGAEIAICLRKSAAAITRVRPTNLFLSGGLDSRIAAGALGGVNRSTTIISKINLSSEVAEKVANAVGSQHTTLIRDDDWYLSSLNAAALIAGGNYNAHHAHFFQAVARLDSRPDEAFMLGDLAENFNTFYWKQDEERVRHIKSDEVGDYFPTMDKYAHKKPDQLKRLMRNRWPEVLQQAWRTEYDQQVAQCFETSDDPRYAIDALFRWYDNFYCPTNMMLECLRPVAGHANLMFDNDLFELVQRVPADIRRRGVLHRSILKHLDKRLLWIPNSNYWLPPGTPRWLEKCNIWLRRKVRPAVKALRRIGRPPPKQSGGQRANSSGSWHLMHLWYMHDPDHRALMEQLLNDDKALPADIFDRQALLESMEAFRGGDVSKLYELNALISFGLLHRQLPTAGIAAG